MGRNDKFIRDSNKKPWLKLQKMINKKNSDRLALPALKFLINTNRKGW
jgi:hypothetical protein